MNENILEGTLHHKASGWYVKYWDTKKLTTDIYYRGEELPVIFIDKETLGSAEEGKNVFFEVCTKHVVSGGLRSSQDIGGKGLTHHGNQWANIIPEKKQSPHSGISKLGTGPGVKRDKDLLENIKPLKAKWYSKPFAEQSHMLDFMNHLIEQGILPHNIRITGRGYGEYGYVYYFHSEEIKQNL